MLVLLFSQSNLERSLLLEHDGDPSVCVENGDDSYQCATLSGEANTLEYLIQELKPTAHRRADVYSAIGANLVDRKNQKRLHRVQSTR